MAFIIFVKTILPPFNKHFFLTKDEHKVEHKTIFLKHRYLHAIAKLATAEGIELRSLSVRVRRLAADMKKVYANYGS